MKNLNFLKILFFISLVAIIALWPFKYLTYTKSIFLARGQENQEEPQCDEADGWNLNDAGECEKEINNYPSITFSGESITKISIPGLDLNGTENATFTATLTNNSDSNESYNLNVARDPDNNDTLILTFPAPQVLNGTYTRIILATKATSWGSGASSNLEAPGDPDIYNGNPWTELVNRVQRIIGIILMFAGIIAVVVIIVGGYNYVTAGGDAEKAAHSKSALIGAVIGLVITFAAYAIVSFVARIL